MSDIERWLERHELERYRDVFVDNELTLDVLPELTEEDLRELGLPMGPRKQILKLIREGGNDVASVVSAPESEGDQAAVFGEAERRQLTVMFVDLVGSTALSQGLDPEDYRDLLSAYHSAAASVLDARGGFIARYMGDGLLVYFGYPTARENDPERAVRAGLELVETVAAIKDGQELMVRVGIATGPVIVGDIVGRGASEEAAVLGETPNLAARLQAVAAPGSVVLSAITHRLVENVVLAEALPTTDLRGFSTPVRSYRAIRARTLDETSARTADATPLVGRDVEVALCKRAWSQAMASDGQALLLVGEAGVGKSRLLRAFQEDIAGASFTRVWWHCSPFHQSSANHPGIEALHRAIRAADESGELTLEGLEGLVRGLGLDVQETVPPLATLAGIAVGAANANDVYTPEELKRRIINAQVELFLAAAARAPVLLLVEDLHWADPTTLLVLREVVAAAARARLLVLMTARPEFEAPWSTQPNAASHRIRSLTRHETTALVRALVEQDKLSAELVEEIAMRTDGVPLFIEELTRNTLEAGADGDLPASLRDSLMARLDRLGPVKELAQVASVLGRSFDNNALYQLASTPAAQTASGLAQLVQSGLMHVRTGERHEFKHALVRDAAYDSMLRGKKQELHARYAAYLQSAGQGEAEPELLARHLEAAGLTEDAVAEWNRAGELALSRAAQSEALAHFQRALALFDAVPRASAANDEELSILFRLGRAQFGVLGGAAPETRRTFDRATEVARRSGLLLDQVRALYGVWVAHMICADLPATLEVAREVEAISAEATDEWPGVVADRLLGSSLLFLGELLEARRALQRVVGSNFQANYGLGGFSHDPYLTAISSLALSDWLVGFPSTAIRRFRELGTSLNPETDDPNTICHSLTWQIHVAVFARAQSLARESYLALSSLGKRCDAPFYEYLAQLGEGAVRVRGGDPGVGLEVLVNSRRALMSIGTNQLVPLYYLVEAEGHLALSNWQRALETLAEASELVQRTSQWCYIADVHRLRGDALAAAGERQGAEDAYEEAMDVARSQGSRSFELRAATACARLLLAAGEPARARALLGPVHASFTEGHELLDLRDAARVIAMSEAS